MTMNTGYMVFCFKCERMWLVEETNTDNMAAFSCEYCSSLGQLDMHQIGCRFVDAEQVHNYKLIQLGLARLENF